MKILITNTAVLNTGDVALLLGEIRLMRKIFGQNVNIHVYGTQTEVAARYYPDLTLHTALYSRLFRNPQSPFWNRVYGRLERTHERPDVSRFYLGARLCGRGQHSMAKTLLPKEQFEALEEYSSADLIVSTGGTYLVEHYRLDARIFDLMTTILLRKPLVLYTQSLGPFADAKNRARLRHIFLRAAAILLRDERSERHIRELDISGNHLHVTADAAFALADPQKWRVPVRGGERLKVAISVREWELFKTLPPQEGKARYLNAMRGLIAHLVRRHNAEVVLLSTCQGIPEYWTDDSRFAAQLRETLPADVVSRVTVNHDFHSPEVLIGVLREFDLVVATRMHMAIMALSAGTPALAIAYEFKSLELFEELGHNHLAHDIESISVEALIHSADNVITNLEAVRNTLRKATARQRERTLESAEAVKRAYETSHQKDARRFVTSYSAGSPR